MKYSSAKRTIEISTRSNNNDVWVAVKDYGMGISSEDITQVTKPFKRGVLRNFGSKKGIGLGLALVQHFLEHNNGSLHIESELGSGTIITMRFPLQRTNL